MSITPEPTLTEPIACNVPGVGCTWARSMGMVWPVRPFATRAARLGDVGAATGENLWSATR